MKNKTKTKNKVPKRQTPRKHPRVILGVVPPCRDLAIAQSRDMAIHGRLVQADSQQQQEARMLRVGLEAADAPLMVNTEPSYVDESPIPKRGFWREVLDFMGWGD